MQDTIIFDAHCDTASAILDRGEGLFDNSGQFSLRQIEGYGGYVQVFAAWIDTERFSDPTQRAHAILDNLTQGLETNSNYAALCRNANEVHAALRAHKLAALLAIEDGAALGGDLDNLHRFYEKGVRFLTLTWNGRNELADGIGTKEGGGLTPFGRQVVREMNALGMAIDVSHLSVRGVYDVLSLSTQPVCATHSNAQAICGHRRNLSDDQFRLLAEAGGVCGINLYSAFVRDGGLPCGPADVYRHIAHFLALDGAKAIGLGADFDGMDAPVFQMQNAASWHVLVDEMRKNGLDAQCIQDITHGNFLRFIENLV